ncbi:MAG: hypothetical protein ABSG13_24735 [Bryobacteraceae bacterium]|jgi:hypothetical protein
MDFTDLQMTLTVVLVLTAAAVAVFVDQRRKQRPQQQPQRVKSHSHSVARPRPIRLFDTALLEYAPAKKLAAERPLEPLVGTTTPSRPPVQMRVRETVTVQMAPPSPPAPSSSTEFQHPGVTLPPFTIDALLWERLISSQPKQHLLEPTEGRPDTIEASCHLIRDDHADTAPSRQPRGMIQQPALDEMLKTEEPFTGLVVSIGINDSDSSMWHSQGLMQSVGNYIASLLREKDISCRTAYDEFVMVCRGEEGAHSQRRLNHISERLWDYQLRGIGTCSILFSWGGVQVQGQPLAEALASATERMRETKRSGKSAHAQRQAV